jgi:hypothetical protein
MYSPDNGTEGGSASHRSAKGHVVPVTATLTEEEGRPAGGPGPGGEQEDDGEDVADQGADAVEVLRRPKLERESPAVDDKVEDGLHQVRSDLSH